jgi:hypothetical protein
MTGIYEHWSVDLLAFTGSLRLYFVIFNFEHLKLLNFDFNSDPDPTFHFNADPSLDPASITNENRLHLDQRQCGIHLLTKT